MTENRIKCMRGWRGEVGLLEPMPGSGREYEILAPEGIKFSHCVLGLSDDPPPENLKKMAEEIETEAKKLNLGFKKDLICLICTAGSFIGGPDYDQKIIERIEKASGSPATTTITCVLQLFADMGIKKLALAGPYPDTIFSEEVKFFSAHGIETLVVKGLGLLTLSECWDYYHNPYQSYKLAKEAAISAPEADCVFLTCMMSNILGVADIIEKEIGKPVISSSSATLYGILKKLGVPDPVPDFGSVLTKPRLI